MLAAYRLPSRSASFSTRISPTAVPTAQTTAPATKQRQGTSIAPSNGEIPVYTPGPAPENGSTPVVETAPENGGTLPSLPADQATEADKTKENGAAKNGEPAKSWYAKPTTWAIVGVGTALLIAGVVYARR